MGGEGEEEFTGGKGCIEGLAEMFAEFAVEFREEDAGGVVFVGGLEDEHGVAVGFVAFHGLFVGPGDEILHGLFVEGIHGNVPAFGVGDSDRVVGAAVFKNVADGEAIDPFFEEGSAGGGFDGRFGEEGGHDVLAGAGPGAGEFGGGKFVLDFIKEGADMGGEIFRSGEVAAVEAE